MRFMNNIEYAFVVKELQALIGKHFENAYSPGESLLRIRIGGTDIICEPGKRLHITKYIEEGELSTFAKILRKELENARLQNVYQYNNDRIIVFEFVNDKKLIFEMFADGNAILVKDEKTIAALRYEEWSDRKIARNEVYKFPKSNIKESVNDVISSAPEKYIIVALMQLPLGKDYATDMLARCKINEKERASSIGKEEIGCIEKEYKKLKSTIGAYAFYENDKIVDFGLTEFLKYENLEKKEIATLSEALDEFYFIRKEEKNEKIEKLKRRLEEQEKRLGQLKEEEIEKKKIGDYIYENYEKIEKLLKTARETDINKLEEKLRVNKKEKEIEIEL